MQEKHYMSYVFQIFLILFGSFFFASCFGISMMPDDRTFDIITLDSNNHPIEYSGGLRDIQEFGWVPFVSSFWQVQSIIENSPAQRYYDNHYVYLFQIESDDYENVTIDSVRVSNAKGKQYSFNVVNRVPFGYKGSCDSTIPDGMVPIDSLPCVVKIGQYNKCLYDDGRKTLIIAIVVDRFRWWVSTLDFDIYLSVRGQQKHYHTSHKKKFWMTILPHC